MSDFQAYVEKVLARHGALVEPIQQRGVSVLSPRAVQEALGIPEWARLSFMGSTPDVDAHVTLETDWLERLSALQGDWGTYAAIRFSLDKGFAIPSFPEKALVLENAVLRVQEGYFTYATCLLLTFVVRAVSDEKKEELVCLSINESTGGLPQRLDTVLVEPRNEVRKDIEVFEDNAPLTWDPDQVDRWVRKRLHFLIQDRYSRFIKGMEQRMNRDIERLHKYYSRMQEELVQNPPAAARRARHEEPSSIREQEWGMVSREYQMKVEDLKRKYGVQFYVEFLQALRLTVPVYRWPIILLRRKSQRKLELDWNVLVRTPDQISCEACWAVPSAFLACDSKLHLLCRPCLEKSGKPHCPLC